MKIIFIIAFLSNANPAPIPNIAYAHNNAFTTELACIKAAEDANASRLAPHLRATCVSAYLWDH